MHRPATVVWHKGKSKFDEYRDTKPLPWIGIGSQLFDRCPDKFAVVDGLGDRAVFLARQITQRVTLPANTDGIFVMAVVGFAHQFKRIANPDISLQFIEAVILAAGERRTLDQDADGARRNCLARQQGAAERP